MPKPHEDDSVLLCMPHGSGPATTGSVKRQCDVCGQDIVASQASMAAVIADASKRNVKWWLVCLECAPDVMPKDQEIAPLTPEQQAELIRELRRQAGDR